jgi:hypothetical protein
MTPGTHPIRVSNTLSQKEPVIPFCKPTARGGRKMARTILRIDMS